MSSGVCSSRENFNWEKAYLAAILEKDCARLPGLIEAVNQTLCERLRTLLAASPACSHEIEAINDALYMLQALRSSLFYREDDVGEWITSDRDQ